MESGFILRKKALENLALDINDAINHYYEKDFLPESYENVLYRSYQANAWFTPENQIKALKGCVELILGDESQKHIEYYSNSFNQAKPKRVAVIPAGNIPAVGFADLIAVYLSGNIYYAKVASSDPYWIPFFADKLKALEPSFAHLLEIEAQLLKNFDAAIATGSNNTARYFEQYFGKYPNIIRKSRSSVAWLDGTESEADLRALLNDMFDYFGMGCRNVTFLLVPENYDFTPLMRIGEEKKELQNLSKYTNNYDYYKSIYLLNRDEFLDNEVFMLKASEKIGSPISVVFYKKVKDKAEAEEWLKLNSEEIQCLVSKTKLEFERQVKIGESQCPNLSDWPDGKNVIDFLMKLVD